MTFKICAYLTYDNIDVVVKEKEWLFQQMEWFNELSIWKNVNLTP